MNRRLKTLAGMFYGRLQAYRATANPDELAQAIWRNVYRGAEARHAEARALATYATAGRSRLVSSDPVRAPLDFGPLAIM
jgi:hypothetical protein